MTSATDPSSVTTTYAYDRAGNRTSVQVGQGTAVTTAYDSASLPTSSSDGLTYTYDAMGTLTTVDKSGGSTGDQCFAYDQFGLLASFKANSTTGCGQGSGDVQYSYDALGRTVSRAGAATTTSNFILDGEDLARTTTAGTATLYAFSPEGLMASSTGGSARFFLKDLHGDTVGAVNASGSVMGSKLYSPWGEPAASAGESYTPGFQSQPTDADTGYVDMTTRLYSPTQGRFSSRDVLFGDTNSPPSMNQYGYAESSPVTGWDPSGMACSDLANLNMRGANNPKVKACSKATSNGIQYSASVNFLHNDKVTRWWKIRVILQGLSDSGNPSVDGDWGPVAGEEKSERWCTEKATDTNDCATIIECSNACKIGDETPVWAKNTDTDDSTKDCGGDPCYRSKITDFWLQDTGRHYANLRPYNIVSPWLPT